MSVLALYVRLHDGRYHGEGDWPPSPARLFQALVAGRGLGGPIANSDRRALEWLERQEAPVIAAPPSRWPRQQLLLYVPNNDSDSIGGDPARMAKIRTAQKVFQPRLFNPDVPFVYAWLLGQRVENEQHARTVCSLAESLYQLGRGIDMAYAWGELLADDELEASLATYPGQVFRPTAGTSPLVLPVPCRGSFTSLERRYQAYRGRFHYTAEGRAVKVVFRQPPKPRFQAMAYDSPASIAVYDLRAPGAMATPVAWPLTSVSPLVVALRDRAVEKLRRSLPQRIAEIERALIGRKADGSNDVRPDERVRIIPLPSIGHVHADHKVRRILVEVPPRCPLVPADVHWAFSGLEVSDPLTDEPAAVLTRADDESFIRHFGIGTGSTYHSWRTITPAALPEGAGRRRIDPNRIREEAKAGNERVIELRRASSAVCQALRHAGLRTTVKTIRLQREPFTGNGARVEPFSAGTRFAKERLWHVEVELETPVSGPLVIGDGRFLGLGLMAPMKVGTSRSHDQDEVQYAASVLEDDTQQ